MEKLTNKQMIERLVSFRTSSDKVNDDLIDLSQKVLLILEDMTSFKDMSEREERIYRKLSELVEPILEGIIDSQNYNESMWGDYTNVVKALGASNDVKNHGD